MGHGILSGCPFHLTRSWTNDMTLSYSELHRWERQSARKRKKSHKRAAASAKKKTLKSTSSTMTKKIPKAPTTSGGKKPGMELAHLQKAKFIMPSTYRQVSGNLDTAKVGTWVFSTAYGIGFFESLAKEKGTVRFKAFKTAFSVSVIRKALDCGALCFVEKLDVNKQREKQCHLIALEKAKIFQQVNFVDSACFKPGRLRLGQEIIDERLKIGYVCFHAPNYVKVRFGKQEIRYPFPDVFTTGKLRLWGGYHGIGYSEKGCRMIHQRKNELQKMIDQLRAKEASVEGWET